MQKTCTGTTHSWGCTTRPTSSQTPNCHFRCWFPFLLKPSVIPQWLLGWWKMIVILLPSITSTLIFENPSLSGFNTSWYTIWCQQTLSASWLFLVFALHEQLRTNFKHKHPPPPKKIHSSQIHWRQWRLYRRLHLRQLISLGHYFLKVHLGIFPHPPVCGFSLLYWTVQVLSNLVLLLDS
jgi:hypothetical protein